MRMVEVVQSNCQNMHSTVSFHPSSPHYAPLPHGSEVTVWTPASGHKINLVSMMISAAGPGSLEIKRGSTTFIRLEFNDRWAVPVGMATAVQFNADEEIKAIFTSDSGTNDAYITMFGYESESC